MKKTQIVLTIDDTLSGDEKKHLRFLLSDALWEFRRGARRNPEHYVNTRYASESDEFKASKIKDVEARNELGARLHNAALTYTLNEIDAVE